MCWRSQRGGRGFAGLIKPVGSPPVCLANLPLRPSSSRRPRPRITASPRQRVGTTRPTTLDPRDDPIGRIGQPRRSTETTSAALAGPIECASGRAADATASPRVGTSDTESSSRSKKGSIAPLYSGLISTDALPRSNCVPRRSPIPIKQSLYLVCICRMTKTSCWIVCPSHFK